MTRDIALDYGKGLKKEVEKLCEDEANANLILVFDEAPDLLANMARQLVERAATVRQDWDCFRLTDDEVVIPIPALPRPTLAELQEDWSFIQKIEEDTSPEDSITLRLATVLKGTEILIDSVTYERRARKLRTDGELLGWQHRRWLLENQDNVAAILDPEARAALNALIGKVYVDFSGIIVVHKDGHRYVPYAVNDDGRWHGYRHWLDHDFSANGRIAVSSK